MVPGGVESATVRPIGETGGSATDPDGDSTRLRGDDSAEQLTLELHALCRYLKRMGVTDVLIGEVRNVTGEFAPITSSSSATWRSRARSTRRSACSKGPRPVRANALQT